MKKIEIVIPTKNHLFKKYERVNNEVYNKNVRSYVAVSYKVIIMYVQTLIKMKASTTELVDYLNEAFEKMDKYIISNEKELNDPDCSLLKLS